MNRQLFNDMLLACRTYWNRYGYFPTVRELCLQLGVHSTSTVSSYLRKLEEEGFIETDHPESPRAYRFKDTAPRYGLRRYRKPTDKEVEERVLVQKTFNDLSNNERLNKKLYDICNYNEHDILVQLIKETTDSGRCELLKNLEYYGNPSIMKIFEELEVK